MTLIDTDCQDMILAHGTGTISVNAEDVAGRGESSTDQRTKKTEKIEKLSRKLNVSLFIQSTLLMVFFKHYKIIK